MKYAVALLMILVSGCGRPKHVETEEEYIHSHHCWYDRHVDGSSEARKYYDTLNGEYSDEGHPGFSVYACPDGRKLFIDDLAAPKKAQP